MRAKRYQSEANRRIHRGALRQSTLMEAPTVADFARGFFEKVVDMLVGRGLHPGFGLDPLRDLDCGIQADRAVEFPPAAEVGFDQDQFVRGDLAETRRRGTRFR